MGIVFRFINREVNDYDPPGVVFIRFSCMSPCLPENSQ